MKEESNTILLNSTCLIGWATEYCSKKNDRVSKIND